MAAAVAIAAIVVSCAADKELPDVKRHIPVQTHYANSVLGFEFKYAPVLKLDADDRGYDGFRAKLLYPGNHYVVFDLNVVHASRENSMARDAIPGTNAIAYVDRIPAQQFDIAKAGELKTRVMLKHEGWLYVFEGRGGVFENTLKTFRFTTGASPALPAAAGS